MTPEHDRRQSGARTPHCTVRIGTSGWHYKHWLGPFYPAELRAKDMLAWYMDRFDTVELNNSFYHLPARETFEAWRRATYFVPD